MKCGKRFYICYPGFYNYKCNKKRIVLMDTAKEML